MPVLRVFALLALWCLTAPGTLLAEVVRVEVTRRVDVLNGRPFGAAGPYEWLEGRILFAFDPANRFNARIVDLDLAPRNSAGKVEVWADFAVLKPRHPAPDGVALLEVSNRGLKYGLQFLNYGSGALRPSSDAGYGDGFLMRQGLSVIWVGWQHDVPPNPDLLRLHAPVATGPGGEALTGLLRADWVVARPEQSLSIAHANHIAYPADTAAPDNVLTVRDGRYTERRVLPRSTWGFARVEDGRVVPDPTRVYLPGGFEPGRIYELVYRGRDPKVAGLGFAVIRDVIAYARRAHPDPRFLSPAPAHRGGTPRGARPPSQHRATLRRPRRLPRPGPGRRPTARGSAGAAGGGPGARGGPGRPPLGLDPGSVSPHQANASDGPGV